MDAVSPFTSRRVLLGALTAVPITIGARSQLAALYRAYDDPPAILRRTKAGRGESEFRYHSAEQFFSLIEHRSTLDGCELLYRAGIVMQLGLSAHLFDVGFTDDWCRENVGLDVAKTLEYANATGLGLLDEAASRLAAILSPYGKWRTVVGGERANAGPFDADDIRRLTRGLLDHVREVTGHLCPSRRRKNHG